MTKHGLILMILCRISTRRLTCGFSNGFDSACQALVQQSLTKRQGEPDRESSQGAGQLGSLYSLYLFALKRLIPLQFQIKQITIVSGLSYSLIMQMSSIVLMCCTSMNHVGIPELYHHQASTMEYHKVDLNGLVLLMDISKQSGVLSTITIDMVLCVKHYNITNLKDGIE